MASVSPTTTPTNGFYNGRSDGDEYNANRGVHTECSPPLVYWSHCPPVSAQTVVPVVADQQNLFAHPQEQPSVDDDSRDQIHISPDELVTECMDSQGPYDNRIFQHGFWPDRWDSENFQSSNMMERPVHDGFQAISTSVFQNTSSPVSSIVGSVVEPYSIPEHGQQTLPTTSAPLQEKADRNKPYAQLIHKALKEAHEYTMTLQDLYRWFEEFTNKPAFIKVEGAAEWTLNPEYINEIQSTTKFRPDKRNNSQQGPSHLKSDRTGGHGRRRGTRDLNQTYNSCVKQGHIPSHPRGRATRKKKQTRATKGRLSPQDWNASQKDNKFQEGSGGSGFVSSMASADSSINSGTYNTRPTEGYVGTRADFASRPY
ncbi:fork head domain-containing protein [Colletotrichum incanum]|uniref:Fork head domain-containing protein n=1 Tax=Colletotrichum incanum TaxID=1573173 RepID=A0A162NXC6_COLIC|nr:fork head domain-containing protein [Colletotrichum incanum]